MLSTLLNNTHQPLLVAHRGGVPENKIETFKKAHTVYDCKMFECDVRLSKDEQPVIVHDRTLQRVTGHNCKVSEMTLDELKHQGIPSFHDVAAWLPLEKDVCMAVELKDLKDKNKNLIMLKQVIDVSKRHFIENRMTIISFQRKIVEYSKILEPSIATGLVYGPVNFLRNPVTICRKYDINQLWLHHNLVTKEIIDKCVECNIVLFVWTVNKSDEYERLVSMGVKHIVTDTLFEKRD